MGNNPINLIDPDGGMTDPPTNGKVGEKFNHPDHGMLTYNGNYWLDGSGQAILNEVVLTGQGKSNFLNSAVRIGADFTPFVGSIWDIVEGVNNGDGWQVAMGAGFLVLDVVTLGSSSIVKGTLKTTLKAAKNSDKLVDIYKATKNGKRYFGQSVDLAKRYTKEEAGKIGPELITQVPERLKNAVEQQLISIHGTTKYGNGLGANKRLQMSLKNQIENKELMKEAMDFLDTNVPNWMIKF
jgi:hypothetical protein